MIVFFFSLKILFILDFFSLLLYLVLSQMKYQQVDRREVSDIEGGKKMFYHNTCLLYLAKDNHCGSETGNKNLFTGSFATVLSISGVKKI